MNGKLLKLLSVYDNEYFSDVKNTIIQEKLLSIKEIDLIEDIVKQNNPLDIDNILYGIMLEVAIYNANFMEIKNDIVVEKVSQEVKKDVKWEDILNYLEIDIESISPNLREEMMKKTNLKSIEETAKFIKNSRKAENRIINKINDIDIIICILLYSGKKYISNIISYFKNGTDVDGRALGKAIEAIPSIFLVNAPNYLPSNYELFIKNYELLKKYDINVRNIIINKPIVIISPNLEEVIESIKEVFSV